MGEYPGRLIGQDLGRIYQFGFQTDFFICMVAVLHL
jgi:hypothetical protein